MEALRATVASMAAHESADPGRARGVGPSGPTATRSSARSPRAWPRSRRCSASPGCSRATSRRAIATRRRSRRSASGCATTLASIGDAVDHDRSGVEDQGPEPRRRTPHRLESGGGRGPAAGRGLSHRRRAGPPAGRDADRAGLARGRRRRPRPLERCSFAATARSCRSTTAPRRSATARARCSARSWSFATSPRARPRSASCATRGRGSSAWSAAWRSRRWSTPRTARSASSTAPGPRPRATRPPSSPPCRTG